MLKKILLLILLSFLVILFIFPTYWMFIGSFTSTSVPGIIDLPTDFWPTKTGLNNYLILFREFPILRWGLNSLIVAIAVTGISVSTSCLAGYAFAKKRFVGKNLLFWLLMSTLMIPFYSVMIPLFITVKDMGLLDTYPGIFLPLSCNAAYIFLARQYMSTLPSELLDVARIDGASELGIFRYVVLPLSKPLIGALAIFTFVYGWKSFMWPLIVTSSKVMRTLPVAIALVVSWATDGYTPFGVAMAGAVMVALPTCLVFIFCQRYFVKGITMGGVKG